MGRQMAQPGASPPHHTQQMPLRSRPCPPQQQTAPAGSRPVHFLQMPIRLLTDCCSLGLFSGSMPSIANSVPPGKACRTLIHKTVSQNSTTSALSECKQLITPVWGVQPVPAPRLLSHYATPHVRLSIHARLLTVPHASSPFILRSCQPHTPTQTHPITKLISCLLSICLRHAFSSQPRIGFSASHTTNCIRRRKWQAGALIAQQFTF